MVNFYALYATEKAIERNHEDVGITDFSMWCFPDGIWDVNDPDFHGIWDEYKLSREEQEEKGSLASDNWIDYPEFWRPLLFSDSSSSY